MFKFLKSGLLAAALLFAQPTTAADLMPFNHETLLLDTDSHTYTHIAELKPIPNSYQLAKATFLPEATDDFGFSGSSLENGHNQGDNCSGYELTSCPVHGSCSSCPFDRRYQRLISCSNGYTKTGNRCKASSCSTIGYLTEIPANKICTKHNEDDLTCYKDCKTVSCSGYTLNCDTFNVANSSGKTMCPDCESANANCSPKLCKLTSCIDGYKISESGTTCVALDDNCPDGYFKSCDTGTMGDPEYTEKGSACYQCKPKTVKVALPILYSDLTTSKEVISSKTPIGIVFDESKKLAIALDSQSQKWADSVDIPGLTNYESAPRSDYSGKNNTKIIIDYCKSKSKKCPAAEYANNYKTIGTLAEDWYLPALGEQILITNQKPTLDPILSKLGGTTLSTKWHWSSSEYNFSFAWSLASGGGANSGYTKSNSYYVRPVISYGNIPQRCRVSNCQSCTSNSIVICQTCNSGYKLSDGLCCESSYKYACSENDGMYGKGTACGNLYKSCGCSDSNEEWDKYSDSCQEIIRGRLEDMSTYCSYPDGCGGHANCVCYGAYSGDISRTYLETWLPGDSVSVDQWSVESELEYQCDDECY